MNKNNISNNLSNVSILVNSCDSYDDLWLPFFTLLEKYWPNHPQTYISVETKKVQFENIITLNDNISSTWGSRFKNALKRIDSDYVIILLDDFFIREAVDENRIYNSLQFLKNNDRASVFYYLDTGPLFRKQFLDDKKYSEYELASKNAWYKLNLQAALWKKDDLISYINDFDTPWSWEMLGTKYLKTNKDFYYLKPNSKSVINYGFKSTGMGVFRGKWVKSDVYQLFNDEKIDVDYSKRGFYKSANPIILLINRIKLKFSLLEIEHKFYKKQNSKSNK